ncbi:SRPBCC family protein [Kitasatospora sp. NPDC086801]|uniref:SRPBCC family protein n=1 Tax=Kitasatospora sp. NPDC086801 TaxID=3364066 RepID=UPI003830C50A
MWEYEHIITTTASPAQVWAYYLDTNAWPEWNVTMEKMQLDGAFKAGTTGVILAKEMGGHSADPAPFKLLEVAENEGFTQETEITAQVKMHSTSKITPLSDGGSEIQQKMVFIGEGSEAMGADLGELLKQNLITGLEAFKKAVETRSS